MSINGSCLDSSHTPDCNISSITTSQNISTIRTHLKAPYLVMNSLYFYSVGLVDEVYHYDLVRFENHEYIG